LKPIRFFFEANSFFFGIHSIEFQRVWRSDMQEYAAIEQRYGFAIPPTYRVLEGQGHFSYEQGAENYLAFYDCEWLPLEGIAHYDFNPWEIAVDGGFVPLAITGGHEPYCWRLDWATEGSEPPIVLCERSERATCLAPNFGGFLYRMALEAFAGRNDIPDTPKCKDELYRAVDILAAVLPPAWTARLRDLRGKPWRKDEEHGNLVVISWQECQEIVRADLSFPHLDEKFIHDKDYLKRLQGRK
jgi:hypothetical protein